MGFGEASYYLPGRSSIQKWKCVVAHFVPPSVAGSYQVSWCMQCTAECLRFAGVRQMQSFFVFNSLRCDPGSSGMWLMRAINIPDLVGSQPCTHKHMHEHACVPQAPPTEDGKRGEKEVGRREKPMNYEKSSSAVKDPLPPASHLLFPPTCYYSPNSACMPSSFNAVTHSCSCGSLRFSVDNCDWNLNNSNLSRRLVEFKVINHWIKTACMLIIYLMYTQSFVSGI